VDEFYECAEDLLDEATIKAWRARREARRKEEEEKEKQQKTREAKEAQAKEAQAKREQRQREAEELTMQYVLWQTGWEADMKRKKMLTTFPHLPVRVCTCIEASCKLRKVETGLLACQHDVERLLRASDMYSIAWLRKERLPWHPDRFGQRCDPDFRKDLKRKATEMYAIFETLIEQEKGEGEA
jgi:predicted ribosome quality control (RQC) complex YloA/Tae2 family protein